MQEFLVSRPAFYSPKTTRTSSSSRLATKLAVELVLTDFVMSFNRSSRTLKNTLNGYAITWGPSILLLNMEPLGFLKSTPLCWECLSSLKLEFSHNIMTALPSMERSLGSTRKWGLSTNTMLSTKPKSNTYWTRSRKSRRSWTRSVKWGSILEWENRNCLPLSTSMTASLWRNSFCKS